MRTTYIIPAKGEQLDGDTAVFEIIDERTGRWVGRHRIRKSDGMVVEDLTTQAYAERLVARGLGEHVPHDEPDR